MSKRFDVCSPIAGKDGKTFWHRVGVAFQSDKGGIGITFNSLPLPDKEGRVSVQLFEPKAKADSAQGAPVAPRKSAGADMDDEVPFSAEFR